MKRQKIEPTDWQILRSCIMGYRAGHWPIPRLDTGAVQEKVDWINSHNTSSKQYTVYDWKNAGKSARQEKILPKSKVHAKLRELQKDTLPEPVSILKAGSVYRLNQKNCMDGLEMMRSINDATVSLAFFDPEYREQLDYLSYGDEGKRQHERAELPQMNTDVIHSFVMELNRVIKRSGYLMIWVDKYLASEGIDTWLQGSLFQKVDFLVWKKNTYGMGSRLRNTAEYLIICQKLPLSAKATWTDHSIPDVWSERAPETHPHAKPIQLEKRLIQATTKVGEVVCDPCAGSYGVLRCCQETGRTFIGSDLLEDAPHKHYRSKMAPLFSNRTDEWETPIDFYKELDKEFHFTLDTCATYQNHKCTRFYTIDDDGLSKNWAGETVWCNPPYSKVGDWAKKCAEEGSKPDTTVVLLLPARTDTKYFHEWIYGKAELRFIEGRLRFGDAETSAPFPSMLAIYR